MNTIVMNTRTASVSEYQLDAHSLTAGFIANETALLSRGGDTDNDVAIDASFVSGRNDWGSTLKKMPECAYVGGVGTGKGAVIIETEAGRQYAYPFKLLPKGESHAAVGRGFRENRFALGYKNIDGADFKLDSLELVLAQSDTRRT